MIAAARRGSATEVAALLAGGADVNELTHGTGMTALHIACNYGHIDVVTILIAADADVNQASINGATPLFTACEKGHTEVVAKLLAANAEASVLRPPWARGAHAVHGLHRARAVLCLGLSATHLLQKDATQMPARIVAGYGVAARQKADGAVACVGEVEEHRDARQGDLARSWVVLRQWGSKQMIS